MAGKTLRVASFLKWSFGVTAIVGLVFTVGCPPGTGGDDQNQPQDGNAPITGDSGLTGKYIGASTCSLCHNKLEEGWSATQHAKALESLEAIGQDKNAACLTCHSTGNGQAGGFVDRATTNSLAGVQCESCHGPGRDHRENVADRTLRPPVNISADVCSQCHNPFHHALFAEWEESRHSTVTESPAEDFAAGTLLNNCGVCHSGDYRWKAFIQGETVSDSYLQGKTAEEMNAVTCVICHDPHERTNKAFVPPEGHDLQLRYAEVAPLPAHFSNTLADAQNSDRFNLCGQCHRSRNATWTGTSRGPHHSVQANFYAGEMPVPDGTPAIVDNVRTVHAFVAKQCVTCHMQEFPEGESIFHASHTFKFREFAGCSTTGCHTSADEAETLMANLHTEIQAGLDDIAARLGDPTTWEYSSADYGGPANQGGISTQVKKVRFMYHYILSDGSLGVHNPFYARTILTTCDSLLKEVGK